MAALELPFVFAVAQEDYNKIFSSDYRRAIQFLTEEEQPMDVIISSCGLKPKEVKSVVFPELIRFNSIQDRMETFTLESLYVKYGKAYANFSIGHFQIKPSFAENVEIDFLKMFGETELKRILKISTSDTIQNIESRGERLKRIKDKKTQLLYVSLFFKLMEQKYPTWKTEEEKIKFFASAYNADYRKSAAEISAFISKKFFHTGFLASTKYSYADVAWYYYRH